MLQLSHHPRSNRSCSAAVYTDSQGKNESSLRSAQGYPRNYSGVPVV